MTLKKELWQSSLYSLFTCSSQSVVIKVNNVSNYRNDPAKAIPKAKPLVSYEQEFLDMATSI